MIKKISGLLATVILTLTLSACGFHLRSAKSLPPQLHRIYLNTQQSNLVFDQQIKNLLSSLNVTLVASAQKAPVTLLISNYSYSHNEPSLTTSNQAITYTYRLSISYQLLSKNGAAITSPATLYVSYGQMMNANQIYLSTSAPNIEYRLQKNMLASLYNQLISQNIKNKLSKIKR